jgi:para-nitrobenzyl esterase
MKTSPAIRRLAFTSAALALAAAGQAAITGNVKTAGGLISGTTGKIEGVTVFKGIPFAAPPVGALRFADAQPPKPWSGVRDGSKYGDVCIQPVGRGRLNLATDLPNSPKQSEDCLTLNVWTTAKAPSDKRAVMVWLYGGAYAEGGGNMPFAEGDALAKKGVIVVTLNYRTGAFGFLSHPELTAESKHHASGNQALSDAIAALQWVKANIAKFGGDPNNVTVFGQSAGACMSAALVGSPAAKGLFKRAISESGAWGGLTPAKMQTRENAEKATVASADKLGAKSLADLRALPADKLMGIRAQGIIVDGWIAPEDFAKTFAEGRQNVVDVLAGSNGDEGASFAFGNAPPMTAEKWKSSAPQRWKDLADQGLKAYPADTDEQAAAAATKPFTDGLNFYAQYYASLQAKLGKNGYVYQFIHRPPADPGKKPLASHASELAYVFQSLNELREIPDSSSPELASKNPDDIKLADQISSYWVNFAKTGNPNGAGLPAWSKVTEMKPGEAMLLEANDKSAKGPALTQAQWDLYVASYKRDIGPM